MAWRNGFLALAHLRADGFAGYEQIAGGSNKTGSLKTKSVTPAGDTLCINADIAPSGYVKVTLFDQDDKMLPEGELVTKTATDAKIKWKNGFTLKDHKGKKVSMKFELRESKIFSFIFKD